MFRFQRLSKKKLSLALFAATAIVSFAAAALPYPNPGEGYVQTYYSDVARTQVVGERSYGNCGENFSYQDHLRHRQPGLSRRSRRSSSRAGTEPTACGGLFFGDPCMTYCNRPVWFEMFGIGRRRRSTQASPDRDAERTFHEHVTVSKGKP